MTLSIDLVILTKIDGVVKSLPPTALWRLTRRSTYDTPTLGSTVTNLPKKRT